VQTPDDTESDTAALRLIGIARRAGRVAIGTRSVKERASVGDVRVVIIARDVTDNAERRVLPLLEALDVPVVRCGTRQTLGAAVGRGPLAVVGIQDRALATGVAELLHA